MVHTYDRDCGHCSPSKYVAKVTIAAVLSDPKADKLEVITFNEVGYTTVGAKGLYKVGQEVYFIPGESMLPRQLSDLMGVTPYLSSSRVKTVRLRGIRSEGLIGSPEQVEPYLDGILKWEDKVVPPSNKLRTSGVNRLTRGLFFSSKVPAEFCRFYDQPALKNALHAFKVGEKVVTSCKVHGANGRWAVLQRKPAWWLRPILWLVNKVTGGRYGKPTKEYVGSHNCVVDLNANGMWQHAYKTYLQGKLPEGYVFFGEVHGRFNNSPIQHLTYGRKDTGLVLFAVVDTATGQYLLPQDFMALCDKHNLPRVQMHETTFDDPKRFYAMADAPSEMTTEHHREGIVICSMERPGVFAKVVSPIYLESNSRTEGH